MIPHLLDFGNKEIYIELTRPNEGKQLYVASFFSKDEEDKQYNNATKEINIRILLTIQKIANI